MEYKGNTSTFTPQEVATVIFKNMHDIAARQVGKDEAYDSVITVPMNFTEKQQRAICEAAEEAGFNVLRIISEPSSALLAYDIGQDDINCTCNVLVYKLGGESVDVTVVRVLMGMYQVLSSVSSHAVSGRDFTQTLVQYFAGEFNRQWKCDCQTNKRSMIKLQRAAETCKHVVSTVQTSQCSVDSLFDGIDFQCTISRGRFEGLCGNLIQNCLNTIDEALSKASLKAADIDKVILCGGSTKIPLVQSKISSYFPSAELLNSHTPDEVIAIGAAKQSSILANHNYEEVQEHQGETQVPCLSQAILTEVVSEDKTREVILPQWTPVPVRKAFNFRLGENQNDLTLHVLSGDTETATSLAKLTLKDVTPGAEIHTVFHVRMDGSLQVSCTETTSNKTQSVTIEGC